MSGSNPHDNSIEGPLTVPGGTTLPEAITAAIGRAASERRPVTFTFNDITIVVEANSNPALLLQQWDRVNDGDLPLDTVVGPHPTADRAIGASQTPLEGTVLKALTSPLGPLEDIKQTRDLFVKRLTGQTGEPFAARQTRSYGAEVQTGYGPAELGMPQAPSMEFISPEGEALWRSWVHANRHSMGASIIAFAERWARLMQAGLSKGHSLEEIWWGTRTAADVGDLSGAAADVAAQALTQVWKHGGELDWLREQR